MTRLNVDIDDLIVALTWRSDEGGHFLDRRTGEVIAWIGADDPEWSALDLEAGLSEGRLVAIEPLPSSVEYGWLEDFVITVGDERVRERLARALGGAGPFRQFKDVLAEVPAERERWFAFRNERAGEEARAWLEENGVEPSPSPRE